VPLLNTHSRIPAGADPSKAVLWGTVFGLASAVGYTAANSCLRAVAHCDPIWVSAVKSFPTVVLVSPWLIVHYSRGEKILPPAKVLGTLALAALLGQLVGNVLFQWSLGVVGIALAVPLTLGTIILIGALLGRAFLNEPLTARTVISMVTLIAAISILSLGAGEAHRSVVGDDKSVDQSMNWFVLAAGVGAATVSGGAYAVLGVVIRYGVTGRASLATTMVTVGLIGILSLGALTPARIGLEGIWNTEHADLAVMLLAGVLNAFAFLTLTKALQLTTVVYVNAMNATQATMAALAGVVFFHEALSGELALGVLLTIVGLAAMKQDQRAG
jgi:drug/metabolite transporter (DMT)-like permease